MNIIKKPYEISIWKDLLMYVGTPKSGKTSPTSNLDDLSSVDYQYYDEEELAIIGSDVMTSPARVINPIFKKNINGIETLTFDMYYQYEENGEIIRNPLINLVIDERKVKLKYEDKWYDFIVKKDDEKGREYKYSYTCTGLAANELGKTGFNIELDTELENNMGTVQELGSIVLDGSDWQLAQEDQEIIEQTNEEALYSAVLNQNITAKIRGTSTNKVIESGKRIYIYYTPFAIQEQNYFQFIYVQNDTGTLIPDLLDDGVTINCNNTRTYDLYIQNVQWANERPTFINSEISISQYRGQRYVKKQLSAYDPVLEQTVLKYKSTNVSDNKEYYGYTTTEYLDSTSIQNYIYNSTNFSGTSYWSIQDNNDLNTNKFIQAKVFPSVQVTNTSLEQAGYLVVNFGNTITSRLVNEGIIQNYSRINKFDKGDKYRLKICVGRVSGNNFNTLSDLPFRCIIKKYLKIDQDDAEDIIYFNSEDSTTIKSASGGYIYVDMICLNSATWNQLKTNTGIFFLLKTSSNQDYYIKDVQFYRYIEKDGSVLEPGDIPEVRIETRYHFYAPADNLGKIYAEDYVFSDSDPNKYVALYGEGDKEFEKIRSITAKETNRFNLLQQLSEIFECWVKFEVTHELNGRISTEEYTYYNPVELTIGASASGYYLYDWSQKKYIEATGKVEKNKKYYESTKRIRQIKKVIFYKEILQDNYAGFKYGINLKDNNRTLDSEQIVTKIIVKDNNCEYAENGFCSIARARDNPIKENFAYNFDYYTSQGIINQSTLNNDLYLELPSGSIGLYPRLSRLNKERNNLIDEQAPIANSLNDLSSKYQVASLTYNEAKKDLERMMDPKSGTIVLYTHYKYSDFFNQFVNNINIDAYGNEIYYIKTAGLTSITPTGGSIIYYRVTSDTEYVDAHKPYYYISGGVFTQLYTTKFREGCVYYVRSGAADQADTYFQTSANVTALKFVGSNNPEVYIYNAARRRTELGAEVYIDDNFTVSTLEKITTQMVNRDKAEADMKKYKDDLDATQERYDSIKSQLEEIAKATEEIEKEFNIKYARYVQEGSWTDDNYLDDDLYYLDALSVLYQSAYPKVSYNFSVLELSQLEGYEPYKFDIGHKTYVEDTEFFGYKIINGLRTPAREAVVVTEANIYLDESDKNQLKVQNYKSHFEDLFQRITAATQSLEYHSGEYARAASAITPEGTVSQSVFQRSLATSNYIIQNSHDQSVVWNDTGIQATNLGDPLQVTRLASSGLLVSADGGQTWGVAISGYGINTNYLSAGIIDADNINIMSGAFPTFRWDSKGLRAYGFVVDEGTGAVTSYDPSRFVVYDRFGIYGINGLTEPNFTNLADVENNSVFALTWNGLFMRSTHRNGYVRISPSEDIVLKQYNSEGSGADILRGKFGVISGEGTENEIYGLALYDGNGSPTVETKSTGTLWLKSQMDIGTNDSNQIYLGVGTEQTQEHGYKVFKVYGNRTITPGEEGEENTDRFIVYEDGTLKARGVEIEGAINASSGTIGPLSISEIPKTLGIRIIQNEGDTFRLDEEETVTPSSLSFNYESSLEGTTVAVWTYGATTENMSVVPASWIDENGNVTILYTDVAQVFASGLMYLKCTVNNNPNYSSQITLKLMKDGKSGDAYVYDIESSMGYIINTSTQIGTETKLTAKVYKNGEELDLSGKRISWMKKSNTDADFVPLLPQEGDSGNQITLSILNWTSMQVFFKVEEAST